MSQKIDKSMERWNEYLEHIVERTTASIPTDPVMLEGAYQTVVRQNRAEQEAGAMFQWLREGKSSPTWNETTPADITKSL